MFDGLLLEKENFGGLSSENRLVIEKGVFAIIFFFPQLHSLLEQLV